MPSMAYPIRTRVAALQNGACAFLEKQMDAETIVTRVRKTVDTWPHQKQ